MHHPLLRWQERRFGAGAVRQRFEFQVAVFLPRDPEPLPPSGHLVEGHPLFPVGAHNEGLVEGEVATEVGRVRECTQLMKRLDGAIFEELQNLQSHDARRDAASVILLAVAGACHVVAGSREPRVGAAHRPENRLD